jgi:hypothetical protein
MSLIGIIASSKATGGLPVSGAALWLDGDDASTFSFSSGTRVSEWRDKSGNTRDFTQATGANQPNRIASQNAKTGVVFNESGTIYCLLNSGYDWPASAFTVFGVVDFNAGSFPAMFGRNSIGALALGANSASANFAISRIGQATSSSNLTVTGSNADVIVYKSAGISSGSVSVDVYKNGTAGSAALSLTTLGSGDTAIVGASGSPSSLTDTFGSNGYICELIVYPSQLSDTDRGLVETYLKNKWGTP